MTDEFCQIVQSRFLFWKCLSAWLFFLQPLFPAKKRNENVAENWVTKFSSIRHLYSVDDQLIRWERCEHVSDKEPFLWFVVGKLELTEWLQDWSPIVKWSQQAYRHQSGDYQIISIAPRLISIPTDMMFTKSIHQVSHLSFFDLNGLFICFLFISSIKLQQFCGNVSEPINFNVTCFKRTWDVQPQCWSEVKWIHNTCENYRRWCKNSTDTWNRPYPWRHVGDRAERTEL